MLSKLPRDMIVYIASFLRKEDKFILHFVNKKFKSMPELQVKLKKEALQKLAGDTGSIALALWLNNFRDFGCGLTFIRRATYGGHTHLLLWGRKNFDMEYGTFYGVIKRGNLTMLKWLHQNRYSSAEVDVAACTKAAEHGNLEIMKWLKEKGYRWTERTSLVAAKNGHLELLKWMFDKGCPFHERNLVAAAEGGQLNVLKWFVLEKRYFLNAKVWNAAQKNGNEKVIQFLQQCACPLN